MRMDEWSLIDPWFFALITTYGASKRCCSMTEETPASKTFLTWSVFVVQMNLNFKTKMHVFSEIPLYFQTISWPSTDIVMLLLRHPNKDRTFSRKNVSTCYSQSKYRSPHGADHLQATAAKETILKIQLDPQLIIFIWGYGYKYFSITNLFEAWSFQNYKLLCNH